MSKMLEKDTPFGFGSKRNRFEILGIHPELITYTTNPLGPGQYNPKRPGCGYKNKAASWKIKLESEEFSKFLGFKNPKLLCDRLFDRTLGGPATQELFDYKEKTGTSCLKNVGFGREKRFHDLIKDQTLPPGIHDIKQLTTKFTKVPPFEWDGLAPRFKSKEPLYRQAPNRYIIPQKSIIDKKVSKRGPYDTFTGPRDQTTIKNHFAPALFKPPDTFYTVPSALDHLLHHPNKKRFPEGLTITATKYGFSMYMKQEENPGPAKYDAYEGIRKLEEGMHPFNSSNIHARPPPNWRIHPGPDRYNVRYPRCHKKRQKGSWMFQSKVKREFVKVESYSNFKY